MISLDLFPLWKSLFSDKNTSSWNSSPKTNFFKYFGFILTNSLHQFDRFENYTRTVLLVKTKKFWDGVEVSVVAPSEQSESTIITQLRGYGMARALHNSRKTLENSLRKRQFVSARSRNSVFLFQFIPGKSPELITCINKEWKARSSCKLGSIKCLCTGMGANFKLTHCIIEWKIIIVLTGEPLMELRLLYNLK